MQVFVFTLLAVPALVGVAFTYLSCTAPIAAEARGGLRIGKVCRSVHNGRYTND